MKPIAVLGVGPAGLMAAHAVALRGLPVVLISKGNDSGAPLRSRLGGAQFLHAPLPMVNQADQPDAVIQYVLNGDTETYRQKVYGDDPNVPFVSMDGLVDEQTQEAWNLIATYDRLWDLLSADKATVVDVGPAWLDEAIEKQWFDRIISSIPGMSICRAHAGMSNELHHFISQSVRILPECVLDGMPDNTIVYEGTTDRSWYRTSRLFGVGGTEWSNLAPDPGKMFASDLVNVKKPLRTNCTCYPDILRVGRYGEWRKGVLTHDAFTRVMESF